jgi:hypothetical protein
MSEFTTKPCNADNISATDLKKEIAIAIANGAPFECYTLIEVGDDGYRRTETGSLVFFPGACWAGIEWGADADWVDGSDAENALSTWQAERSRDACDNELTRPILHRLRKLGLTAEFFARVMGYYTTTVLNWGKPRTGRGVQEVPPWVGLLLSAWEAHPDLIPFASCPDLFPKKR